MVTDPRELKIGEKTLVKFTLASNRFYRNKEGRPVEEKLFFPVDAWDKIAGECLDSFTKGLTVIVEGRIKQERWETKEGTMRTSYCIVAQSITPSKPIERRYEDYPDFPLLTPSHFEKIERRYEDYPDFPLLTPSHFENYLI